MIRINLLPDARKQTSSGGGSGQGWIIGYLVAAAALVVVLVFVYLSKSRELSEKVAQNNALQRQITDLESESANIDEVRAELEQSRQLEAVVDELQRARYGPTAVLMELSAILSVGGGPTVDPERLLIIRRDNPLARVNEGWDPRRLWLSRLEEEDRTCVVAGSARTNEDIAELLRRLTLSDRFENVELVRTEGVEDNATSLVFIDFIINAGVIY